MKKIIFLVAILLIPILTGCSAKTSPDITGLLYQMEDDFILVVEGIDDLNTPYDEWFEKGNLAIVFQVTGKTAIFLENKKATRSELKTGQKVEVWATGGLAKSYPMQGTAKRINIIPN